MKLTEPDRLFLEFPPITTDEWEERIKKDLKGDDYTRKLIWNSPEGFPVKPYYREEDLEGLEYLKTIPGEYPYLRGFRKEGNEWSIRQDIPFCPVGEANQRARNAISCGAQAIGLNVRELVDTDQMHTLLNGIDLDHNEIHFSGSRSYPLTMELFLHEVNRQKVDPTLLHGSFDFDPLSYLLTHGEFHEAWNNNLEEAGYIIQTLQRKVPSFHAITINGHRFQDAGSTLVQELAFSLASANEYLAGLTEKGVSPDAVAPRISFTFALGSGHFLEIAKLRAARLLWAKIVDQYHPGNQESCRMNIHCVTARWNKTIYDPFVNLLRTTTEGISGALGNADSLSILPFDIPFEDPIASAERHARNQQLIFKEESYLDKVVDPAAGSYFIENLTDSMAYHAWNLFKEVEERSGMMESIKQGVVQDSILASRKAKEKDFAQRKLLLVGSNQYPNTSENVLEKVTREVSGKEQLPSTFTRLLPFRVAEPLETLRLATERHVASGQKLPSVFLFTMGNLSMLRARAGFATNFFGCAGYHIQDNPGFKTIDEGVLEAVASSSEIVVICSSDDEYPVIVPEITAKLKHQRPSVIVVVAGYPVDVVEELRSQGVDDFIHIKSNVLEELTNYQHRLGIQ